MPPRGGSLRARASTDCVGAVALTRGAVGGACVACRRGTASPRAALREAREVLARRLGRANGRYDLCSGGGGEAAWTPIASAMLTALVRTLTRRAQWGGRLLLHRVTRAERLRERSFHSSRATYHAWTTHGRLRSAMADCRARGSTLTGWGAASASIGRQGACSGARARCCSGALAPRTGGGAGPSP